MSQLKKDVGNDGTTEHAESQPDSSREIGRRAELLSGMIKTLGHDMNEADVKLADIKDLAAKTKFTEALKQLRERVDSLDDPNEIARKMGEKIGPGAA